MGLLAVAAVLVLLVLAGAGGAWYYVSQRGQPTADVAVIQTPPASQPVQAGTSPAVTEPVQSSPAAPAQAVESGTTPPPASPAEPGTTTPSARPVEAPNVTPSTQPAQSSARPAPPQQPRPGTANPRTLAAGAVSGQPGAPATSRQDEAALPQGILIFLDADQSGERLPLGTAQARIAEVVRQSGYQVVSSGAVAANVRTALDRRDLSEVRRNGVGYVIMGTAHGSLEQQNAYGSTYNVARASITLELVRMSDGAIASTGSGDARSRGSANATAALQEAVTTAASDAARALMRDFKP